MGMSISYDIKNPFRKKQAVFFFNGNVSRHFPLHVSIHCWAKEVDRVDYILNVGKPKVNPKDTWRIIPVSTLPETNIAPENGWLEYCFPIGEAYFQGLC